MTPVSGLSIIMLTGSIANRSITQSRECLKRKVCDTQVGEDCCVRDGCARNNTLVCRDMEIHLIFLNRYIQNTETVGRRPGAQRVLRQNSGVFEPDLLVLRSYSCALLGA